MVDLGDWNELLAPLFKDERYVQIRKFLFEEYNNYTVYPDMYDLYNCFRYTPFKDVKAVLLGQDPYHNEGQAHGLCFSVKDGVEKPPSLENIFKELQSDLGCDVPRFGKPHQVGATGRLNDEHFPHGARPSGEFPFQMRLGLVYGQRNSADFRKKGTRRLYSLGRKCAEQKAAHRYGQAFDFGMRAPFPSFRFQRLFRLPPFFQNQRLSERAWYRADRLGFDKIKKARNFEEPQRLDTLGAFREYKNKTQ